MVLLFATSRARVMVYVRARDSFKRDLRMFIRTYFNFFRSTFRVGLFNDNVHGQVLFINIRASVSQRNVHWDNGLVGTIRICVGELRIARNRTYFFTTQVFLSGLLVYFSHLIVVSFLVGRRASFYNDFSTSQTFKVFIRRFLRKNSDLVIIVR